MSFMEAYRHWLEETIDNEEIHGELVSVQEDPAAIEDRFYRELEFGTGGLRGVLGAGSNRMNVYTVGKATQGYSNYLKKNFPTPSVAIAYDSRIHSDLFAQTAAAIFAANGIQVHLYPKLMPTPALSFAVRDLHCSGGIVITASHNPSKYNGYKVYGSDGCQITTEAAKAIQWEIDSVDTFTDVPAAGFKGYLQSGQDRLHQRGYSGTLSCRHFLGIGTACIGLPGGFHRLYAPQWYGDLLCTSLPERTWVHQYHHSG